jgi:cation transport ATPase
MTLVPRLIVLGRRTRTILTENIVLALGLKAAVFAVAVAGPPE